jgi:hypothetical protein
MRNHPDSRYIRVALLSVCVVALLAAGGCSRLTLPGVFSGVIEPSIVPAKDQQGFSTAEHDFDFEGSRVKLRVPVDRAVYAGAKNAEKTTTFIGRSQPADWVGDHYRSFVSETHQEQFFISLLDALHAVRDQQNLSSSRYVELVTSMTQTLEYRIDPVSLAPKFPIETLADGYGDCDDKTLLAAALLARDGYDVAILFFEPEKHVALGIRAPGLEYRNTGYAFAETTLPSLIGVVPEKLAGDITLESKPTVVKIGSGQQGFEAGEQITFIEDRLKKVRKAAEGLSTHIASGNSQLNTVKATLDSARREAESATDPSSAGAVIDRYNRLVKEYNGLVAQVNALVARHNALVEAERYAIENQTARPQIYDRLRRLKL